MEVAHSNKHLIHENSVCSDMNRNISFQVSTSVIWTGDADGSPFFFNYWRILATRR